MKPQLLTIEQETEVKNLARKYYESIKQKNFFNEIRLVGIEVEFSILDSKNHLHPNKSNFFSSLAPGHPIVPELGSYQIEINPEPFTLDKTTFKRLYDELQKARNELDKIASDHNSEVIPIGLPFFLETSFLEKPDIITDKNRYLVSADYFGGLNQNGTKVGYHDGGFLVLPGDSGVTVINELHVQLQALDLTDLVKLFNYSQMITAPFITIGANSGITNGKQLEYNEQQIDIFEKSEGVFDGVKGVPRVGMFPGYISTISDFIEVALSFKPLYYPDDKSSLTAFELMLGIYYSWTRIRHGLEPTPHWRIEFRPFSSQPTMIENIALSELYVKTLLDLIDTETKLLPEEYLKTNFEEAIKHGMHSKLYWDFGEGIKQYPVDFIVRYFMDAVFPGEYLHMLEKRVIQKTNPSEKLIRETKEIGYAKAIENYKTAYKTEEPYIH